MDPYGPVWVRMVPGDSLGASWGLLGPWAPPKGGFQFFGVPYGLPSSLRGILTYLSEDPSLATYFFPGRDGVGGWG